MEIKTIEFKDDVLHLIDQRKLPISYEIFQCKTYEDVDFAIKDMVVRGAPAIGVAAAYGVVLAAKEFMDSSKGGISFKGNRGNRATKQIQANSSKSDVGYEQNEKHNRG